MPWPGLLQKALHAFGFVYWKQQQRSEQCQHDRSFLKESSGIDCQESMPLKFCYGLMRIRL
jgi:hypothetical protein